MAKRGAKTHKSEDSDIHSDRPVKKKLTAAQREELLIENFVGLQHAMTNLSIRFEKLSDHMLKLLEVFEEAARNFSGGGKEGDADLLNKIDSLLNQNKTIAKGLVLMEEKLRGRVEPLASAPVQSVQNTQQMQPSIQNQPQPGQYNRPRPLPQI